MRHCLSGPKVCHRGKFLTAAKQAKNARMYPANNELRAIQQLSERNVFDAPTINILIDYILQNQRQYQSGVAWMRLPTAG